MENNKWLDGIIPDGFRLTDKGVFKLPDDKNSLELISGPIKVISNTQDIQADRFGIVLRWIDIRGKQKEQAFPAEILYEQGKSLAQELARRGLYIKPYKERILNAYLSGFLINKDLKWIQSVSRVGWLDSAKGTMAYITPERVISRENIGEIIFQPEQHSPTSTTMYTQGTLEDWKINIAQKCQGNPYLIFSICTAFASTILKYANLENGGFHFYGRSSGGKTTCLQVAASVFGCGADPADAPDQAYIQRWNTTGNALEALLSAHNDGLLALDEIHTCDTKDFGRLVYNMSGGKGKAALDKNRNLKQQRAWRTLYLSTGELSAQNKIDEGSSKSKSGQLLRLIDIPTDGNIIINAHGKSAGDFAISLKRACSEYFGIAGISFITNLVNTCSNSQKLSMIIRDDISEISRKIRPDSIEQEQARGLNRFALVLKAGLMACDFNILPLSKEEIASSIHTVVRAWLADSTNLPDRLKGALNVQNFILKNQSRFRAAITHAENNTSIIRDLAGYTGLNIRHEECFFFTQEGFQEACSGQNVTDVAREIDNMGFLISEKGRLTTKQTIDSVGRIRLYTIKKSFLEHEITKQYVHNNTQPGQVGQPGQPNKNNMLHAV